MPSLVLMGAAAHLCVIRDKRPQLCLQASHEARTSGYAASADHVRQQQGLDVWVLAQSCICHLSMQLMSA